MPLSMSAIGTKACIQKICGKDDIKRYLEHLGFIVGGDVTVISELDGNIIVNVKDSRIAISKAMANRILVA